MKILKNLSFLTLIMSPLVFGAVSKTFTVTAPTERENGDALTVQELDQYRIECGTQSGGPYDAFSAPFPASGNASKTFVADNAFTTEGQYFCTATVTDTDGLTSERSNEINFTVGRCALTDCRPQAPRLSVTN